MDKFEKAVEFIKDSFNKLSSEDKKKLILLCTAGFAVLLTLAAIVSAATRDNTGAGGTEEVLPAVSERLNIIVPIPAEELFLPEEPDFIPGVLLERERRTSWTEEDAAEFWQDPLRFGEEGWRQKIEKSIDEFLERVP